MSATRFAGPPRSENRSLNLDLRILGLGEGGGSNATTDSLYTKYCSDQSAERRDEFNYQQYLEGIEPGAYAAYQACTTAASNDVEFQMLTSPTRDVLELVVFHETNRPNARADMSWSASDPVACQWESFRGNGEVEAPQRRILEANERTRLKCRRDSYNTDPVREPDFVNVIRNGGNAAINVPWLKYNEQGESYQTLDEIRQQIDTEVARLRNEVNALETRMLELAQEPIFGDWKPVVVSEIHRAESDGFLTAFSGGNGNIAAILLETGESADRLGVRNRGGRYEGAAIPVKKGHYYRVRMRSGSGGTVNAFWLQVGR